MDATERSTTVPVAPMALLGPFSSRRNSYTDEQHQAVNPAHQSAPLQLHQVACDNETGISAPEAPEAASELLSTTAQIQIPQVPEIPSRVPEDDVYDVKPEPIAQAMVGWRNLGPICIPEPSDSPREHLEAVRVKTEPPTEDSGCLQPVIAVSPVEEAPEHDPGPAPADSTEPPGCEASGPPAHNNVEYSSEYAEAVMPELLVSCPGPSIGQSVGAQPEAGTARGTVDAIECPTQGKLSCTSLPLIL